MLTNIESLRFGLVAMFYAIIFQLPSGPSGLPQNFQLVVDLAKVAAWIGIAVGVIKGAKQLHLIYQVFWVFVVEHRLVTADLWERRPDKKEEFDVILNQKVTVASKARAAGA